MLNILMWRAGLPALECAALPLFWGRYAAQRGQARSPRKHHLKLYAFDLAYQQHVGKRAQQSEHRDVGDRQRKHSVLN